jgi:hypothetical protein
MIKKYVFYIFIVLSVFLCAQFLEAQYPCGYSYYPGIETPHPYGKVKKGEIIWSDIIYQGGASWIKIHFTDFHLDDEDYVDLIDKNGAVVVRIKGSDVSNDSSSNYKVIPTGKKKVNFWAPSVEGDMVSVELKGGAGKYKGKKWGFTIDEVGVGVIPFREEVAVVETICGTNNLQNIECYNGFEPYDRGQAVGRMLYRVNGTWYLANGFLLSCDNSSHFFTCSDLVFHQHIVNTLEVAFNYQYSVCSGTSSISSTTYFGDQLVDTQPNYKYTLLTLKNDPEDSFKPLQPHSREPTLNENIYLIQHPNGDPKMIGFGNVSNPNGSHPAFFHYIDTPELTSMGSPILNDDGDDEVLDKVLGFVYDNGSGCCPNRARKMSKIYNLIKNYIGCN